MLDAPSDRIVGAVPAGATALDDPAKCLSSLPLARPDMYLQPEPRAHVVSESLADVSEIDPDPRAVWTVSNGFLRRSDIDAHTACSN